MSQCIVANPLKTTENIKIISIKSCGERFQMDLVALSDLGKANSDYKYILNVIYNYSKILCSFPLKKKSSIDVVNCLRKLFYNVGHPLFIHSDNGKEFKNMSISNLAKNSG